MKSQCADRFVFTQMRYFIPNSTLTISDVHGVLVVVNHFPVFIEVNGQVPLPRFILIEPYSNGHISANITS